ncbi:glycosyltransferase family 4 protein [Pengzhenrongella frigida]|uniref:D-inositol 3-phosphate glycosyltransferase n=1 Tax=Pengzhenrongella frigida TaxID=1259133 RepID=A0A4Q5N270_9MICO|nr:glycosyltransferase family 4 protein [Cellulomonas sp. HLT2-17]RYV52195.1 glycosyltransferase family 1 protein [Cellulomonas sp. HLT2-17]
MLIAHVSDTYPPRTGGIESQVSDLATRQAAAGHEVHVLTATLGEGGERGGVVDVERGVAVHRLGTRLPFDLPVNPAEYRLITTTLRALRPDVVHVHAGVLSPFAFDGARAALAQHLPVAITWHCMLDGVVGGLRLGARLTRWDRRPIALSAVSDVAAARVAAVFGGPVAVVPNGLDVQEWAPDPAREVVDADGPLRLVATMRLAPRKRAVPLIEVVAAAAGRLEPGALRLDLIGSGPALAQVTDRIERWGLSDTVRLRGRLTRDEVRAVYRETEVFLAPAELESFGIAALEARVSGLAVVARLGTGITSFIGDGTNGLLVADDAGMADGVVRLARDRALLAEIRLRNRQECPELGWARVLAAAEAEYSRAGTLVLN